MTFPHLTNEQITMDDFPEIDASIRKNLNTQLETEGLLHLQNQLKILDEASFKSITKF